MRKRPDAIDQGTTRNRLASTLVILFVIAIVALISCSFFQSQFSQLAALFISIHLFIGVLSALFFTNIKTLMVGIVALCVCLSIWTTEWPLHVRFQLSKGSLERLLADHENGKAIATPQWAGLFRIVEFKHKQVGAEYESVRFITTSGGDFQGLAFCPQTASFNVWTHVELGDNWHFVIED